MAGDSVVFIAVNSPTYWKGKKKLPVDDDSGHLSCWQFSFFRCAVISFFFLFFIYFYSVESQVTIKTNINQNWTRLSSLSHFNHICCIISQYFIGLSKQNSSNNNNNNGSSSNEKYQQFMLNRKWDRRCNTTELAAHLCIIQLIVAILWNRWMCVYVPDCLISSSEMNKKTCCE